MKKKSKILWMALIAFILIVIGVVVFVLIKPWKSSSDKTNFGDNPLVYYPANYEADIMQNRVYLSYDRDLLFGTPYDQQSFTLDTDRESATEELSFFLDFFSSLIQGDYENIVSFFTEGFFNDAPRFTPQMIHDMSVTLHSVDRATVNGMETEVYSYTVIYEIFQNNGTWRKGVGSNEARPQIFQLVRDDAGYYKIFRILDVTVE